MKHQEVHPFLDQADCFMCRVSTVQISASALPTRREHVNTMADSWDKQMRDDAAYRRLRKDGLQPARTAGCHELEQVDDSRFIEALPVAYEDRAEFLVSPDIPAQVKVET